MAPAAEADGDGMGGPGVTGSMQQRCADCIFNSLNVMGIRSWEEAYKVSIVTFFCFTANTILLLGRNIGATMLLTGLGADALPYCYVLVGFFIMIIMPVVANLVGRSSSRLVLAGTTVVMVVVLTAFLFLFVTGLADEFPRVVYPLFFVLEEVIDSLLMVLFWQSARHAIRPVCKPFSGAPFSVLLVGAPHCRSSPPMPRLCRSLAVMGRWAPRCAVGMLCFTKDEATRLIGIVNMGAAVANLANGVTVGILIYFFDSFAILPAQMVLLVVQLVPTYICGRWVSTDGKSKPASAPKPATSTDSAAEKAEAGSYVERCLDKKAWYMHPLTQLIAIWQFATVLIFSCIEFQYNATLANFLDANGIAQVTANLASVASLGQTCVNLLITPFLLQSFGVWAALLVTPAAYVAGEGLVFFSQTVAMVFICRSMDFIFRYTVSDNTKQILYKSIPPEQLIEARSFVDGTIKKLGPMFLGTILIAVQNLFNLGAYAIVGPMSFYALAASIGLMPLVLHLANMSESDKAAIV